ncbi:hypothetical protein SAMN02745146_3573 [Hymenobacter daecheongensis DSM 21074]|uniref:Uncharacterized protein n=1 Tax=Hymenobacter daecheongensis DSM 21074 TaxID=1121955 RepID=A0A1M6KUS3_9BACT|nr:hypothetical protein [Hymenobacter daecheongensis]SHJ62725.1 hypothetical protein SAMN02745146_3573 [Hymenobacter daecheongensis DSM 21074]
MSFISLTYFLLFLLAPPTAQPQPPIEPLQIAEQFVAPEGWPDMKSYLCCEAADQARRQTLGQQIPRALRRRCQLLRQDSARAVVAVELRDSTTRNDFYLHFRREPAAGWKLQAVRSLAASGLSTPMLRLLTQMPPAEIARYNQAHPAADHAFTVGNLRLWMSADADIARHFSRRRRDFQQVVRLVQARPYFAPSATADSAAAGEQAANADPAVRQLLRTLFISRVGRHDTGCGTCLEFIIGGTLHNSMGLLYQPDAAAVPAMSPAHIIVIRPLGQGWYLYKTT